MGIYTMGPHREAATELASITGAKVFVETGTYKGKTTRWAAERFDHVYTVERAKPFYDRYAGELTRIGNITTCFGDSRDHLPKIIEAIGDQPALLWLDGHWSGGVTAGADDECPVLDELLAVSHRVNDIIMIDDARLFLAAPPVEFDADQWPSILQIADALGTATAQRVIQIFHDTIFLGPNRPDVIDCMRRWARLHAKSLGRESTG